ncbi:synaptosomal-associated protein 47 [Elysia marginata]|uniref:Synaptosomal-associated protein 47 n=1 Tax=Elysia marginata TaxID=1093978 RepID=A0AAV4EEL2_9GAST|nr:synaptosomal-associated protein 47 [Elysia marginata]
MQDIHQDLTVAERITAGLNSWLGRWKMSTVSKPGAIIFLKDGDVPDMLDVEVLYTKVHLSRVGPQTCGVCRIESNGVTILDMKQKVIHHFKWSEISRVRAVSPWEIMLTQYLIGHPDLSYNVVSVHMPSLLSKITDYAGAKVEYIEPSPDKSSLYGNSKVKEFAEPPPYKTLNGPVHKMPHQDQTVQHGHEHQQSWDQSQISTSKHKETVISDAEVDELTATLNNIKATALAVQTEQDSQLEDIDELTSSVVRANDRVRAMNKTMGKLLK